MRLLCTNDMYSVLHTRNFQYFFKAHSDSLIDELAYTLWRGIKYMKRQFLDEKDENTDCSILNESVYDDPSTYPIQQVF